MLLPIYVLFISESYKREKEAQGINESNGFARYRILVSLIEINCVITGIILSYIYKMYSSLQDGCGSGTTAQLSSNSPDSSSIHNCLTVRLGMLKPSFAIVEAKPLLLLSVTDHSLEDLSFQAHCSDTEGLLLLFPILGSALLPPKMRKHSSK